jgi:uncharacterized protein HemX
MKRRTFLLLAAVTIVGLGLSAGCAVGGQKQEVAGSQSTGNDQNQEAKNTNGEH